MVAIDFSFSAVSVPAGASASVTIYEDVGNDGGANSETVADGYSVSYDNKDTVALSDGTTSYTTADAFDGTTGNGYQVYTSLDNTDVTVTASETWNDLTLDVPVPLIVSAPVTTVTSTTPNPAVAQTSIRAPVTTVTSTTPNPALQIDIAGTEWRVYRDGVFEDGLYDVEVVDTANPFGNYAIAFIDDNEGSKFEEYSRGTKVEFQYITEDTNSFTTRFTGYVVERRELDRDGADALEVECYSFDQFLRRNTVSNDLSGNTIAEALESIVTNDTPVTWNAANVTVSDPQTLTQSYRGERVENALQSISNKSGDEAFGVNDSLEFFFRERESQSTSRDIDNSQWFDYDIPERGKGVVNQVTVFYANGTKSVTVEDGGDKAELQGNLGTEDVVTLADEVVRDDITDVTDARAVGEELLRDREPTLTGTVTTFGLLDADPGDVVHVNIIPRGIDTEFRIAEIQYFWASDQTVLTIVEKRGNQDDLLVNLSDSVKRIETRDADRDATGTRITDTSIGVDLTVSGDVDGTAFSAARVTNALRNQLRDGWAGDGTVSVASIAVGDDAGQPKRSQTALGNELASASATEALPDSTTARYTASLNETDVREIGLFDGSDALLARAIVPETTFSGPVDVTLDVTVSDRGENARGVITDTGQTAVRDIIADNSPALPAKYAYGTDGTMPTTSDTALGSQAVAVTLDEILLQSADSDSEWGSVARSIADDTPLEVTGGELKTKQTCFTQEGEDYNASSGSVGDVSDAEASGGTGIQISADGSSSASWTFTPTYDIPASEAIVQVRDMERTGTNTGVPQYAVEIDAGDTGSFETVTDDYDTTLGNNAWQTFDSNSTGFNLTTDLASGDTHRLRIQSNNSPSSPAVTPIDVVAPADGRYNYTLDNDNGGSSGYLDGPEFYPDVVEREFATVTTERNVDEATVTQTWDDTGNDQFIALSNDGGSTFTQSDNTATANVTFGSLGTDLVTKVGISRHGTQTGATPLTGTSPQAIDGHAFKANISSVAPVDIGVADVQGVVTPNTTTGSTLREGGQLTSADALLTRAVFAEFTVQTDQRVISSERVAWQNPS